MRQKPNTPKLADAPRTAPEHASRREPGPRGGAPVGEVMAMVSLSQTTTAVRPAILTAGIVVLQIALGAATVFAGNGAATVAVHLIAGGPMLVGATVAAVCVVVPVRAGRPTGPRLGRIGWLAISTAAVLFVSGSLTANAGAEEACASFPLCPSGQPGDLVWPHLLHRSIAVLAALALFTFSVHVWRAGPARPELAFWPERSTGRFWPGRPPDELRGVRCRGDRSCRLWPAVPSRARRHAVGVVYKGLAAQDR